MGDLPARPHGLTTIGDIVRFGLAHAPTVRGVHFQPVSYFGRYPPAPTDIVSRHT